MSFTAAKMMSLTATMSSPSPPPPSPSITSLPPRPPEALPLRPIPGAHGPPVLGPMLDRLDYFWFQGPETFFKKRIERYKSTVFRTNVPPSFPFIGADVNPNVVAVLDCKSFSHLFDMEVVEKKNVLVGDFMPSVKFTGDMRVCAYLDTTEPQHAKIKNFAIDILRKSSKTWISELTSSLDTLWDTIESDISKNGSAGYLFSLQKATFSFLSKILVGADPAASPEIANSGYAMVNKWLAIMLLPTIKIGVVQPLEEIFIHSFPLPFFLVKDDYKKLYDFFNKNGQEMVKLAQTEFGLTEEEAVNNLLFIVCFNAYGGFSILLPSLINAIASDKTGLQEKLRNEVREKTGTSTSLSFDSIKEMELVNSVVYETLRLSPPVPSQFGRARKDFKLCSHDSVFEVKKGELLCGFQPLVMRDPKVFDEPEKFKYDRFVGEEGRELLNYLFWSNGPQTGSPSESNKQCAGKDIVTMTAALFVAHMFQRYDSVTGDSTTIKSVQKAR